MFVKTALGGKKMLIYYLALIGIALVLDAVIILKMNISKIAYKGTGLLYFCYAIFLFGIIGDFCKKILYIICIKR